MVEPATKRARTSEGEDDRVDPSSGRESNSLSAADDSDEVVPPLPSLEGFSLERVLLLNPRTKTATVTGNAEMSPPTKSMRPTISYSTMCSINRIQFQFCHDDVMLIHGHSFALP